VWLQAEWQRSAGRHSHAGGFPTLVHEFSWVLRAPGGSLLVEPRFMRDVWGSKGLARSGPSTLFQINLANQIAQTAAPSLCVKRRAVSDRGRLAPGKRHLTQSAVLGWCIPTRVRTCTETCAAVTNNLPRRPNRASWCATASRLA